MYSQAEIASAVAAGALSADAAEALHTFKQARDESPQPDEENVRLVTSFNDIFVTIAGILLFMGLGALGGPILGPLLIAAAAWGLAEYFTLKRRMALPSIVLLLAFVGGVGGGSGALVADVLEVLGALLAVGAAWLHWRRFHVPITVAAGVAAGIAFATGLLAKITDSEAVVMPFLLLCGLGTFAYAMRWDAADTSRRTAKADIAFWLHVLAAVLIVHPVFQLLNLDHASSMGAALVVLAIYVALSLVALVVDRRALMASALAYVLAALVQLVGKGTHEETGIALAALVIGSALLLLSALWHKVRAVVMTLVPDDWRKLVPPVAAL